MGHISDWFLCSYEPLEVTMICIYDYLKVVEVPLKAVFPFLERGYDFEKFLVKYLGIPLVLDQLLG